MARTLRDSDYNRIIKAENLEQIIKDYESAKLDAEQAAQEEMISKLKQRYIVNQIFTDTTVWSLTKQYKAKNLVEYTEDPFTDTTTYSGVARYNNATAYVIGNVVGYNGYKYTATQNGTGNLPTDTNFWTKGARTPRVSFKGSIYEAIATTNGPLPTDVNNWVYVCEDLALFYVTLPKAEFDIDTVYSVNNQVFYLDKVYTAIKASTGIIPSSSPEIWGSGTAYLTAAGVFPDDTSVWTKGDNRNSLIVMYLLDMTLYHLLSRMPRNFSDLRKERYDGNSPQQTGGAIGWLKRVARGEDNASLPEIIETKPIRSITHGSARNKKQNNFLW